MKTNKIHKLLLITVLVALFIPACDEKSSVDYAGMPAPEIQLSQAAIDTVQFGSEIQVTGSVTSQIGIRDISYLLLKKDGTAVTSKKYYPLDTISKKIDFVIPVTIDDDEVSTVEVSVTDVVTKNSKTQVTVKNIKGVPTGNAYVLNSVELAPEYERPTDPSQPCLFSAVGVNVNGTVKNVLTLKEAKDANVRGIDFAFINLWKNTQTNPPTAASRLGNRGFAFCDVSQLSRGPIGRQCDISWLPIRDTTCMQLVPANVAAANNFDQIFANAADNWKTFKALNQVPVLFPTWTVGTHYNVPQRLGASADNTTACSVNYQNGSYIVFRRQNNKDFKYGIIKIVEVADDSDALATGGCKILGDDYTKWYTGPGLSGYTYNGVGKLYGRKIKINVICQK